MTHSKKNANSDRFVALPDAVSSVQHQIYEEVKALVAKMKEKYPPELNLEGLEPALTSDIAEIVAVAVVSTDMATKRKVWKDVYDMAYEVWEYSTSVRDCDPDQNVVDAAQEVFARAAELDGVTIER